MKRYSIEYKRPDITPEEAKAMADFNQLLIKHQSGDNNKSNAWRMYGSIGAFIALVGVFFYMTNRDFLESDYPVPGTSAETTHGLENPQLMEQSKIVAETHDYSEDKPTGNSEILSRSNVKPDSQEPVNQKSEELTNGNPMVSEAYPIDGFPALYQYFDEHLVYPTQILDQGVEGNVIVKFVIDVNGLPTKIVIEKSLHEKLDSVAVALIQQMPRWHPASLDGLAIPSTHRIPLFFQINQAKE